MADETIPQDLPEDPVGWAALWTAEIGSARRNQEKWWERAERIVSRYLDDRNKDLVSAEETRLNLFTSNTQTMESLLFGKTPQVDVARRFADSADDQARVAAEMLERLLNTDIERDGDSQQEAFRNALADRLRAGLGNVFVRYDIGETVVKPGTPAQLDPTGNEVAPKVPETETRPNEKADVDYKHWKDQLWSPCRTFAELRWWAFGNDMSEKDFIARFGEEHRKAFTTGSVRKDKSPQEDAIKFKDPLARCYVWEIWSKERKTVDWFVEGYTETLDHKDDPLGLDGFWPFPRPMFANLTTSKLIPTPDFVLAQDLYDEVDTVSTRITILERAIRLVGVYDSTKDSIKRMINETAQAGNELIPVDNWAMFAEGGGVKGFIDWMPLEAVVAALEVLRTYRTELIGLLYQITGMSDIMRGQASEQTTATEQAIKARFASVRVQSLQDEFARFCSDVQRIKAEIISKHFEPQTIIDRSNVMRTPDARDPQLVQAAVALIKDRLHDYRISVNPDSVSLTDFAALKQERFEWMQSMSGFFQASMPVVQAMGPGSIPFLLELAQWTLSGLKGSNEIEGVFDQAIAAIKQQQAQAAANPQPPPEDPQLQVAKVKAGAEQFKAKADVQKSMMDIQIAKQKHGMEMQKMAMDQHLQGRQMANDSKQMDMQQEAAQADHNRSMQSQEGQERLAAMKAVNKVTDRG